MMPKVNITVFLERCVPHIEETL